MGVVTEHEWDDFLSNHPYAHLLQSCKWGELKSQFGWQAVRVVTSGSSGAPSLGAQVLFRQLPMGLTVAYIPKGPVGVVNEADSLAWNHLTFQLDELCRQKRCIFLKIEPDLWEQSDSPDGRAGVGNQVTPQGFIQSRQVVQPPRTLLVDLRGEEEAILGRMKQKARYNIRLALKKGVVVSESDDLKAFHHLIIGTGRREGFGVHNFQYYQKAYDLFHARGECALFLAEYEGHPIAALMVFARSSRAWYFYGASADEHREKMPNYLIQWEAMRWARSRGCTSYDLWGVPDRDEGELEAKFTRLSKGLWGVYRFKRGFGGRLYRAPGPWDRVYKSNLYALYQIWARFRAEE